MRKELPLGEERAEGAREEPESRDIAADGRLRLFVALELPPSWIGSLGALQGKLRSLSGLQFRWVRPELMHLTLVFLSDHSEARLPNISCALEVACSSFSPFHLRLAEGGFFGPIRAPRVLWVAAQDEGSALLRLRTSVDRELETAGVAYDRKPMVSHITLARQGSGRSPRKRVQAEVSVEPLRDAFFSCLKGVLPDSPPPHLVGEISLVRSQLFPTGPQYTVIRRFPLAALPQR